MFVQFLRLSRNFALGLLICVSAYWLSSRLAAFSSVRRNLPARNAPQARRTPALLRARSGQSPGSRRRHAMFQDGAGLRGDPRLG
jgi:hypothetical protein